MTAIFILGLVLVVLATGGVFADYVFPHIPWIEKSLEKLPLWKGDRK